ncbi:MAG: VanZ family protein [Anaerolineales bacterium]
MKNLKTWALRWGPALVMMAVIFAASSTPQSNLPKFGLWDFLVKKGGHMLGYALLALAYTYGLAAPRAGRATTRQLLLAVLLATLYAVTDEFHQWFVSGRGATVRDVLIDGLGAIVGVWSWSLWLVNSNSNSNSAKRPNPNSLKF